MPRKYKLRIHKKNAPLLVLPEDHPARRVLVTHAECRRDCVGRELSWEGLEQEPIDQEWRSSIEQGRWSFSGFAYAFVSFDLILLGWIERPDKLAPDEIAFFERVPRMKGLLQECEDAARAEQNERVLPLIQQVRDFIRVWNDAVQLRLREDEIDNERNE